MIDDDTYQFHRREIAAYQRRRRWQRGIRLLAYGLFFAAGFILGWLVFAKW